MAEIIKLIKTIPEISSRQFEKGLKCSKFWEACIDLPKVQITSKEKNTMHWKLVAHFILDPLGVAKVPVEVEHDLHHQEDVDFKGEGMKWRFWTTNSTAVEESEGLLFFKESGGDTKIMLQVTKLHLKAGFLDVAGLGKSMVITRLKQELQNMITKLIEKIKDGSIKRVLEKC